MPIPITLSLKIEMLWHTRFLKGFPMISNSAFYVPPLKYAIFWIQFGIIWKIFWKYGTENILCVYSILTMYNRRKKRNTFFKFCTNYCREMKLVPFNSFNPCTLIWCIIFFFLGARFHVLSLSNFNFFQCKPQHLTTKS